MAYFTIQLQSLPAFLKPSLPELKASSDSPAITNLLRWFVSTKLSPEFTLRPPEALAPWALIARLICEPPIRFRSSQGYPNSGPSLFMNKADSPQVTLRYTKNR